MILSRRRPNGLPGLIGGVAVPQSGTRTSKLLPHHLAGYEVEGDGRCVNVQIEDGGNIHSCTLKDVCCLDLSNKGHTIAAEVLFHCEQPVVRRECQGKAASGEGAAVLRGCGEARDWLAMTREKSVLIDVGEWDTVMRPRPAELGGRRLRAASRGTPARCEDLRNPRFQSCNINFDPSPTAPLPKVATNPHPDRQQPVKDRPN